MRVPILRLAVVSSCIGAVVAATTPPASFCSKVDHYVTSNSIESQATRFCSSYLSISTRTVTSTSTRVITKTDVTTSDSVIATYTVSETDTVDKSTRTTTITVTTANPEYTSTTTIFSPLSGCYLNASQSHAAVRGSKSHAVTPAATPAAWIGRGNPFLSEACECLSIPTPTQTIRKSTTTRETVTTKVIDPEETFTYTTTTTTAQSTYTTTIRATVTTTTTIASILTVHGHSNIALGASTENSDFDFGVVLSSIVPQSGHGPEGFSGQFIAFRGADISNTPRYKLIEGESLLYQNYYQLGVFSGFQALDPFTGSEVPQSNVGCEIVREGGGRCILQCALSGHIRNSEQSNDSGYSGWVIGPFDGPGDVFPILAFNLDEK